MLLENPLPVQESAIDELLSHALRIRDLMVGAGALLRVSAPSSALHELVAASRVSADAMVHELEQQLAVSTDRAREHMQAAKSLAKAEVR